MNPPVYWPDESLPLAIYCAPGVLTGLEILATDGLLAMPRTGLGIGGLLLGWQSGERIEILKTVAISCSHAMGPSFVLTPEEIAEAKASEDGIDEECALIGWYCSKPNGRMVLSENDVALFDALCGERGQVALLIRPSLGRVTLATFALRGEGQNGDRFQLGTQGELVTPEKTSGSEPEFAADGALAVEVAPQPVAPRVPEEAKPERVQEAKPERVEEAKLERVEKAKLERVQEAKPGPTQETKPGPTQETKPGPTQETKPGPTQEAKPRRAELPVKQAGDVRVVAKEHPTVPLVPWRGTLFGIALDEPAAEVQKRLWLRRLLFAIILLAVLAAVAYLTRSYWTAALPRSGWRLIYP